MNTAHWMLECVTHRRWPSTTITAPPAQLRVYSMRADDNRRMYIAQSAATKGGAVPPINPEHGESST